MHEVKKGDIIESPEPPRIYKAEILEVKKNYVKYDHHDMEDTPIPLPFVEVPYRALLPKGLDNVIVAGRSVSVEWQALGPIRIMPCCFAMGQAAGTAAAMCVRHHISPKEVDIGDLQASLQRQHVAISLG